MKHFFPCLLVTVLASIPAGAAEGPGRQRGQGTDGYVHLAGVMGPEDARAMAALLGRATNAASPTNLVAFVEKALISQPGVPEYMALLEAMNRTGDHAARVRIYEDLFRRYPAEQPPNLGGYRDAVRKMGQSGPARKEWMRAAERQLNGARVSGVVVTEDAVWAATDRGAYRCNRKTREWMRFAVSDEHLDRPVESITLGEDGRLTFVVDLNDRKAAFVYDPGTLQWKAGAP